MSEKKFTVVSLSQKEGSKVWRVTLESEDGKKAEVKHWANAPFVAELKEGAVNVCEFEKKDAMNATPNEDGSVRKETWLKRWGAAAPGRGGGKQWQPKPESETLSAMAQTAIREAVSATGDGADEHEIAKVAKVLFDAMIDMVRSAKGKIS